MATNFTTLLSDDQWKILNKTLRSIENNNTYILELSPGTEHGENWCGVIVDAEVKWSNKQTSSYFVIKIIPPSKTLKLSLPIEASYVREIYMYSIVFPEFEKFQTEKRILKQMKSYPQFYKTLPTNQEMLVFENKKKLGFRHINRHQPLDYDHMSVLVKEYAQFHALSFAIRDQKPQLFRELAKNTLDHIFDFNLEGVAKTNEHRIGNALKSLDPILDKFFYDKFAQYFKSFSSVTKRLINDVDQYAVISHIDTGISNYLFRYNEESVIPNEVCILDYQLSRLASPAVDLAGLIFSASDKALRNRYDDLILEYYNTLSLFLRKLGCDAEKLLPFNVLKEQLKKYSVVGLLLAIQLIYVYSTSKVPDIVNEKSHKEGLSYIYELEDRSIFDKRVRDVIIDFILLGYDLQ